MAKRTSTGRQSTATRSRKSAPRKRPSTSAAPLFGFSLRPEHQRELFALALITTGLLSSLMVRRDRSSTTSPAKLKVNVARSSCPGRSRKADSR